MLTFLVAAGLLNGVAHPVPTYGTETDLIAEYIPAARSLASGVLTADRFTTKGPGYPLVLSLGGALLGGDLFATAKVINTLAAAVVLWGVFVFFGRALGAQAGLLILVGVAVNPTFLRATVEAGTDLPAMAIALSSACLALGGAGGKRLFLAGILAGYACLTRSNYVFLPLVTAVGFWRAGRVGDLAAYAAACLSVCLSWPLAMLAASGMFPRDTNYIGLAYMIYGANSSWESFLTNAAPQFNSYRDVLFLDPAFALQRLVVSAATRWFEDARHLVVLPLGLLGIAGMVWRWRKEKAGPDLAAQFLFAYGILCLTFYNQRFSLYLLPFYLSGAVLLLRAQGQEGARDYFGSRLAQRRVIGALVLGALYGISAVFAIRDTAALLRDAPIKAREIGHLARQLAPEGAKIMARKPHVAYYASMDFVPLPRTRSLTDLTLAARGASVQFVFISAIEAALRPEYAALLDSGLALPGLRQILYLRDAKGYGNALYRVEDPGMNATQQRLTTATILGRQGHRSRERAIASATEHLYALQYEEAVKVLRRANLKGPADADVAALLSNALHGLGRYEEAAEECLRSMALGEATPAHFDQLGRIRFKQGRFAEASEWFRRAIQVEPAIKDRRYLLGLAEFEQEHYRSAATEFRMYLEWFPTSVDARRMSARSLALAGDRKAALQLLREGPDGAQGRSPELQALEDSLRREESAGTR